MATRVILESLKGAGPKQRELVEQACFELGDLLNRPEFYDRVRAAHYGDRTYLGLDGNFFQATPDQIVNILKGGVERGSDQDFTLNLHIELVKISRSPFDNTPTMGWVNLGKQPIHSGYWFVNKCMKSKHGAAFLAGHLLHEWLHVAGFSHRKGAPDPDVPYVVGSLAKNMLSQAQSREKTAFDDEFEASLNVAIDPTEVPLDVDGDPTEFPM